MNLDSIKALIKEKSGSIYGLWIAFVFLSPAITTFNAKDLNMVAFTDTLFGWNQMLLHIPLFMMLYCTFASRWTWRGLAVVFLIVFLCSNFAIIDLRLHQWLEANHYYPSRLYSGLNSVNSNYAKIVLAVMVAPPFLIMFYFKKYRTMDRFLVFLMSVSIICTHMLFHWVWMSREYTQIKKHEFKTIEVVLSLGESSFKEVCVKSQFDCWYDEHPTLDSKKMSSLMLDSIKSAMDSKKCIEKPCVFPSGRFDLDKNQFFPASVGISKKDGVWRYVADNIFLQNHFLEIRQGLTTLGIAAGNVWTYGLIVLWAMHQRRFRKRKTVAIGRLSRNGASADVAKE